jgi:hypothetical protein
VALLLMIKKNGGKAGAFPGHGKKMRSRGTAKR